MGEGSSAVGKGSSSTPIKRLRSLLVGVVSRVPAPVQVKLLVAFLIMVALLVGLGAVGLQVLSGIERQTQELNKLQRKIEAYRQVQHDITSQLYSVTTAMVFSDGMEDALRQLAQFGYDLERLQFVTKNEVALIGQVRDEYKRFIEVVTRMVSLLRQGEAAQARDVQRRQVGPLADRLERLTNKLVNLAEADMVAGIEANEAAYSTARWAVIVFALGSILLALGLGYVISWSIIEPIKEIEGRLQQIAGGDFTQRARVANRDELGALAANVNQGTEQLGNLYRQIEEKGRQIEIASQHKSQFLANMSHELRTPLNAVLGFTEMLTDGIYGPLPDRAQKALGRVQANGRHLLDLINDVLDLSKIEAGQLMLAFESYSMAQVVEAVVNTADPLARAKGLRLGAQVDDALPLGRGDERRLIQVLLNLVANAIKFTDVGSVEISARASNQFFHVAVQDTGSGIPIEHQQAIFEEFQQVDSSMTRTKGGTGLGLAISKRIVEMHGGTIGVESTPDVGSTFSIVLPVECGQRMQAA